MASGLVDGLLDVFEDVLDGFSRILVESRSLWDSDPLLSVRALCLERYGRLVCSGLTLLDLGPVEAGVFLRAVEEAGRAGLRLRFWGPYGFTVDWEPAERLARLLEELAGQLARETGAPIEASAVFLPVSEDVGRVGGRLRVSACVPGHWEVDSVFPRLNALLEALERRGASWTRLEGGYEGLPYKVYGGRALCAGAVLAESEAAEAGKPEAGPPEGPGEYMTTLDEAVEAYFPADPDSIEYLEPHKLYWYLPYYEPPWPCPRDLADALAGVDHEVILDYGRGAILRLNGSLIQVDCGPRPGDNTVRVLKGGKEDLIKILKTLAARWATKVLDEEELGIYLDAVKRATSLEELVDAAREAEHDNQDS